MGRGGATGLKREARSFAAVLSVFALLILALIPAAAAAAQRCDDPVAAHCQHHQVLDGHGMGHRGVMGMPCHDCVAVSIAAVPTPGLSTLPVRYIVVAAPSAAEPPDTSGGAQPIRLRPPSTAPPRA